MAATENGYGEHRKKCEMETTSSEVITLFGLFKLLKSLAVFLMCFPTISLCSTNDPACKLFSSDNQSPMGYSRDGEVTIAGILQILLLHDLNIGDFSERPELDCCVGTSFKYLKHLLAFIYAIEEINNRTDILPNVTLGFQIYDSCTSENVAIKSFLNIISESWDPAPNYICKKSQKTIAVVGHLLSSSTHSIARLTQHYGYPQISYGAFTCTFGDSENFPLLYQTVPSELSQFRAIVQLLLHFEWTWVGIITTDENRNQQAALELKKQMGEHGICVDFMTFILKDPSHHAKSTYKVVQTIEKSSVKVIILYCTDSFFVSVLQTSSYRVIGKVWITTIGMDHYFNVKFPNFLIKFNGSLVITIEKGKIPGFTHFLYRSTYVNMPDNDFVKSFWMFSLGCMDGYENSGLKKNLEADNLWKNLLSEDGATTYRYSYAIFNAVRFISEALHHVNLEKQQLKQSPTSQMSELKLKVSDISVHACTKKLKPKERKITTEKNKTVHKKLFYHLYVTIINKAVQCSVTVHNENMAKIPKLNRYLKLVSLKSSSGVDIFFNEKGYIDGRFDILNLIADKDNKVTKETVGNWMPYASDKLQINNSGIFWNPYFNKTPQSLCSYPCSPGYWKSMKKGKLACCFGCVLCKDGEISNGTAREICQICPDDQWSNPTRDKCIKRPLHFLSYEEELGRSLATIATIFFGMTSSVLWVFVKHRNTPLVRANNRNLSYVLLVSLMISFLLSFLFIGHPRELTCLMRQTSFGFVFAVAVSSVLGKTTTVLIAFNATKPGSKLRKCVGSRIPTGLVILCSLGEFIICVTWLICFPPFVELNTKTISGTIIVQCNEGSIVAFYVAVSYIGILAVFSFVIAFISRKLPDIFNEAQHITLSMLVFCIVWMSFIPTYLCTKGKYMVAVEIFAVLSSNGALLCFIFLPKCKTIVLKPEDNRIHDITIKA
ncbi:vomeronasal type-2 receptor 26-like [Hyla sarda]|uniref:vomeronasal type-2 receptor 26-like n=1 Tax=Hyla sarda TaxID=327740 RepID=UPI0024C440B9|nr:vomeronasal type-2 receptor 26-like [Hyla sarda]